MASQGIQLRSNEMPEYSLAGPFGGIQSEVTTSEVEQSGFVDALNILFRKAGAYSRCGFADVSSPAGNADVLPGTTPEPVLGIVDFFNVQGTRVNAVLTPTRLLQWSSGSGSWIVITGPLLTGGQTQLYQWSVVGAKLYFSQGNDPVMMWDGMSSSFAVASANAVPSKYLFELGFHLIAANTIEGGVIAPQRVRWTGAGDGTDWTSFNAGQVDLFNDLGPITGCCKLFQSGYIFQQWGITQVTLTGNGLAPFAFIPMGSKSKGNICPYSLASFGEDIACYVGKNNVYLFDGSTSTPIGSRPLGNGTYLGARKRIFADLKHVDLTRVFGFISTSSNGQDYESYWLLMPDLLKAWIYHFDEGNWTQITYTGSMLCAGTFSNAQLPRIMDLTGQIATQSWTPITLTGNNPLDNILFSIGSDATFNRPYLQQFDFSQPTELPWSLSTGELKFGDARHEHTTKKVRFRGTDLGQITVALTVVSDTGDVQTKTFTYGTGSGKSVTKVIEFGIHGKFLTFILTGPPNVDFHMQELAIMQDTGGEVRGG